MKTPGGYPFAAIAGQPELKLALLLASVDWQLSVLLKGDKGSGKSTAARALADILPDGAPFVNLPIGTTEDRLLGGLDLASALEGRANLKRGLIHESHSGVLYIDEVNLLSDSLTDALLDVASSGKHHVERDGFSAAADARFVLLGSMNIEEGALRPQLLDRFALSLDVEAPLSAEERAAIVGLRLRFDADPVEFCAAFEAEQGRLRQAIVDARSSIGHVATSAEMLHRISQAVTEAGVRSLRADLAALRASMAHAALAGRCEVVSEDLEAVLPLVLHHRRKRSGGQAPALQPKSQPDGLEESDAGRPEAQDRMFPMEARRAPELRVSPAASVFRGRSATASLEAAENGKKAVDHTNQGKLDVVGSFTQSFRNTGTAALQADQLVFRTTQAKSGVRYIFVVDSSGSHSAQQRMRAVKGIAAALLQSSIHNHDEVAVVSFRGAKAEIVLEPCRDADAALRAFEFLPTGGRTPLAHALELAGSLVNPASVLVLLTDGRANVPLSSASSGDAWTDALAVAGTIHCPALIVDSSIDASTRGAMEALAAAMRAKLTRLDDLSEEALMTVFRN